MVNLIKINIERTGNIKMIEKYSDYYLFGLCAFKKNAGKIFLINDSVTLVT
jgi:hypothetical protein